MLHLSPLIHSLNLYDLITTGQPWHASPTCLNNLSQVSVFPTKCLIIYCLYLQSKSDVNIKLKTIFLYNIKYFRPQKHDCKDFGNREHSTRHLDKIHMGFKYHLLKQTKPLQRLLSFFIIFLCTSFVGIPILVCSFVLQNSLHWGHPSLLSVLYRRS